MLFFCFQWVGSIDMKENEQADCNVIVKPEDNWQDQVGLEIFSLCSQVGKCVLCLDLTKVITKYKYDNNK